MADLKKKKSEAKSHNSVEDFIPYANHFNEETILTKNGELIQTIQITGFPSEILKQDSDQQKNLREQIREALKNNIKTDDFSFWLHTIRAERDISVGGEFKDEFSVSLNEGWNEANKFRSTFVNELYITIISEGWALPLKNPKTLIDHLFPKSELTNQKNKFLAAAKRLNDTTNKIIHDLEGFGARKLSIFRRKGIYHSELISFISKIMNLKEYDVPLAPADLSMVMPTHKVVFQYNTIQVEGSTGRHFGAVLSVKEYHEVAISELEKLIQLPVNLIITETFNFVNSEEVLENFSNQKKIYDISGKKYMAEVSTIEEIYTADKTDPTCFGEHQITISILEDSVKAMQAAVSKVVDALREIGVVFVREDLFIENCYWSSLPANFDFIKRKSYILTNKIAGFCSLYNFTTGKQKDNYWGDAVTIFNTEDGNPYFFNFHYKEKGNTLIVGSKHNKNKIFTNFLLSQSQKYDPKVYIIESGTGSKTFVETLGGKYSTESEGISATSKISGISVSNVNDQILDNIFKVIDENADIDSPQIVSIDVSIFVGKPELKEKFEKFSQDIQLRNTIIIYITDGSVEEIGAISGKIYDDIKTRIFLSNFEIDEKTTTSLGISKKDAKYLKSFKKEEGQFLISRFNNYVLARYSLKKMPEHKAVLYSDDQLKTNESADTGVISAE